MEQKRFGALSSSVDPQKLSLTITAGARLVLGILATMGIIGTTGIDTALEQIPATVAAAYASWQALEMLYGLVRKIIVALAPKQ